MNSQNPVTRLENAIYASHKKTAAGVFISITARSARDEAKKASGRFKTDTQLGPLDGYLVAIKANIDLVDIENTAGSIAFSSTPAKCDAELVKRLRSAGAIILGHTNMSEFAFSGLGLNPHFGNPINPLSSDTPLIPGGSSSGSATAVSLGIADVAIGTDTSGSIRIPAAFQGLVGYRPSMGRYSLDGVFPLAKSLDTPGSLSKTVNQIIALDNILADNPMPETINISELTFVAPTPDFIREADNQIQVWFEEAIEYLEMNGAKIERRDLKVLSRTQDLFAQHGTLVAVEARKVISKYVDINSAPIDSRIRSRLESISTVSSNDINTLYDSKKTLCEEARNELSEAVFLMPTTPNKPPSIAEVSDNLDFSFINAYTMSYTMLLAYLDMPTIALPIYAKKPGASLSIVCAQGEDDKALAIAQQIERIFTLNAKA